MFDPEDGLLDGDVDLTTCTESGVVFDNSGVIVEII
jgi:hypothetical protein